MATSFLCPAQLSPMRSGAVLFSSTSSLAHSRKIVALYVSDSSRACPTSLFLFSSVSLELHERGVTRQTCPARFWRFLCPSLPCSATSHCSAGTGLPPTPGNPAPPYLPHPRLSSLPSSVRHLPRHEANPTGGHLSHLERGSPVPLAIIPRQVSAPFVPRATSHHGSSSCARLTEHSACRTKRT